MISKSFKVQFEANWFNKKDIIKSTLYKLKVLSTPKYKWYSNILKFISFGLYKPSIYYKAQLLK